MGVSRTYNGVEYALPKLALFYHHRNWRLAKKRKPPIEVELWPHLCSELCDLPDTNQRFGVPQDMQKDAPEEVDEDQLVELCDAIYAAAVCVRDEMNDLFLQHTNMRILDGLGKEALSVQHMKVFVYIMHCN